MEFDLIARLLAATARERADVVLGAGDDAAVLAVPAGQQLVASHDTLVEGVHFLPGTAPRDLGWKALAVNLSDLAAMGASPAWALLSLTLPAADSAFVDGFAKGFDALAGRYRLALVGGDTTGGPLAFGVTVMGFVPTGKALRRSGAGVGDIIMVTGALGAGAAGLHCLAACRTYGTESENQPVRGQICDGLPADSGSIGQKPARIGTAQAGLQPVLHKPDRLLDKTHAEADRLLAAPGAAREQVIERYLRPESRVEAGLELRELASACMDLSDGLLADLAHLCRASGVGAEIEAARVPRAPGLEALFDAGRALEYALGGGDDYELCFTVPARAADAAAADLIRAGHGVTRIGRIVAGQGVKVLDADGHAITPRWRGWEHFG